MPMIDTNGECNCYGCTTMRKRCLREIAAAPINTPPVERGET